MESALHCTCIHRDSDLIALKPITQLLSPLSHLATGTVTVFTSIV